MAALSAPTEQREVAVKGALNLHTFKQYLDSLGVTYDVVPLSGDVPVHGFTEYYTNRTVRISATAEQWERIERRPELTRHDQPGA